MKILFVSSSPLEYSSSANMRNLALLKGLIESGNEIYTLTPKSQVDSKFYDESLCDIKIKEKYYIEMGNIQSKLTVKKGKKSILKSFIYKTLSKFKIYDFRSTLANKKVVIKEKFDIIISSSDPKSSHLIAESLINNNPGITKRWIQYWGDPFASDINKKSLMPKFMIEREENRIISKADKIVYVSPFTCEEQKKKYKGNAHKMSFIPIAYKNEIIYEKTNNSNIVLGYYGDYNKRDRDIIPLYDYVKNNKNINLHICGNSDLELECKENIIIETRQNIEKIRENEAKTDILVCVCNKSGTQIPGKVYHYAATNKPILILLENNKNSEFRKYFDGFDRYILCNNNEEEIEKTIKQIISQNKEYFPCEKLKPKSIAKEFVK